MNSELLRGLDRLRLALARGRDDCSERQTGELRDGVMDRLAGSAQGACDGCMVSALDMH